MDGVKKEVKMGLGRNGTEHTIWDSSYGLFNSEAEGGMEERWTLNNEIYIFLSLSGNRAPRTQRPRFPLRSPVEGFREEEKR